MPITPLAVPAGPDALEALPALERALTGTAPIHPHQPGPPPQLPEGDLPDDLAIAIATSGSTGTPKHSLLTAASLIASADATAERLGGHGQWLLALPGHHIAGLQVLLRSIAADGGYELVLLLAAVSSALALTGPGAWSADAVAAGRRVGAKAEQREGAHAAV